jgi:hypothetical protein
MYHFSRSLHRLDRLSPPLSLILSNSFSSAPPTRSPAIYSSSLFSFSLSHFHCHLSLLLVVSLAFRQLAELPPRPHLRRSLFKSRRAHSRPGPFQPEPSLVGKLPSQFPLAQTLLKPCHCRSKSYLVTKASLLRLIRSPLGVSSLPCSIPFDLPPLKEVQ